MAYPILLNFRAQWGAPEQASIAIRQRDRRVMSWRSLAGGTSEPRGAPDPVWMPQRIGFSNALFLAHGTPNTAEPGRNTAPDALESVFGYRLSSAGDQLGVDGPAKMRLPLAPSTGYPLPSGRFHREDRLIGDPGRRGELDDSHEVVAVRDCVVDPGALGQEVSVGLLPPSGKNSRPSCRVSAAVFACRNA